MIRSGEEILADIDTTLDQLIQNAEVLQGVHFHVTCENEIEALQKTQESLMARLIHMDLLLKEEEKKGVIKKKAECYGLLQEKIKRYTLLNQRLLKDVAKRFSAVKPRIGRNRKKSTI